MAASAMAVSMDALPLSVPDTGVTLDASSVQVDGGVAEAFIAEKRIGERIKHLRLKKSMGLVELGRHTGLSASFLSQLETGRVVPTLRNLARIAMVELKYATERLRPYEWLKRGGATFFRDDSGLSFPSGHVVSFASVAIPLAVLFPRARVVLLAVVAYVVAARVVANAHWVSDTLAGISLVCVVTWACGWTIRPRR